MNEAFGEGRRRCFLPQPGDWRWFPAGQPAWWQAKGRGPAGRDPGGREAVQADPRQVPSRGGAEDEKRLYCWLRDNFDTTFKSIYAWWSS